MAKLYYLTMQNIFDLTKLQFCNFAILNLETINLGTINTLLYSCSFDFCAAKTFDVISLLRHKKSHLRIYKSHNALLCNLFIKF